MASTVPAILWPINYLLPSGNPLCQGIASSSPLDSAQLIQGDQRVVQLYYLTPSAQAGGAASNVQLPAGATLTVAGKEADALQAETVLFEAVAFSQLQDASNNYYYQAFLDLDTDEIAAAFAAAGDGVNTLACLVDVIVQVPAQAAAAPQPAIPAQSARFQISVTLKRQVFLGTESNPTPATPTYPPAVQVAAAVAAVSFAPSITSVGDGAPGSLEAVPTVGLGLPALREFIRAASGALEAWVLLAGVDVTAADGDGNPSVQRPADYAAGPNARVWYRKR